MASLARVGIRRVSLLRAATALALLAFTFLAAPARAAGKDSPPELLATIAIGPDSSLRPLQAYVDAVQPGAGALVNEQMVRQGLSGMLGGASLDGFARGGWAYVLFGSLDGTPSFALLGKVKDPKALASGSLASLTKGGWGVVGAKPLLDKIGDYALTAIASQPAPRAPTAVIYLPQLLAKFRPQVDAMKAQMVAMSATDAGMGRLMQPYLDGFGSLADDTERIVLTLETTAQIAWLDFALQPRAGSRLARFAALQRPSDYALLDRLPATAAAVVFAGHLELGPYHDGLLALMAAFWSPGAAQDLTTQLAAAAKVMTGDVASAIAFTPGKGMAFTQLYGTTDTAAADKAMVALLDLFKNGRTMTMGKATTTIHSNAGTTQQHGIALRSYDTVSDFSKMTPEEKKGATFVSPSGTQRAYIGSFDKLTMVVAAPDSLAEAGRAIDAVRGKAAHFVATAAIGTLLDAARARKDSVAAVIDAGPILAGAGIQASDVTFLTSLGFADKAMHIRLALPSASLATVIKVAKP